MLRDVDPSLGEGPWLLMVTSVLPAGCIDLEGCVWASPGSARKGAEVPSCAISWEQGSGCLVWR